MNARILLVLSGFFLFLFSSTAQTSTLRGTVVDETDNPVANASVTLKGTNIGTTTDQEGHFALTISSPGTLVISSVNFVTTEIGVTPDSTPFIRLQTADESLSEVIVVAYGTQRRSEVTSAISTVSAATIKNQQIVSVGQALQGTAPGVMVVNSNGQPGENPAIRIRGVASLLASASPLIVLDGIVYEGNMNMISPNDIDNISVLKDATASALYGSRAANGVILINTKSGKKNSGPEITLTTLYGVSSRATPEYKFLNTQQHFELGWESIKNLYTEYFVPDPEIAASEDLINSSFGFAYNPYGPSYPEPVGYDGKLVAGAVPLWNDNWVDALTNNAATRKDINIGIGGGTDRSRYYFSGGFLKQQGFVSKSDYERISARLNYTTDLTDWLELGARVSIVSSDQNYPNQGTGNYSDVIGYGRALSSVFPIYARDDNGEIIYDANNQPIYDFGQPDFSRSVNVNRPVLKLSNVPATLALDDWWYRRLFSDLNTYAKIKILRDLYFKSSFGINRTNVNEHDYQNRDYGDAQLVGGRVYSGRANTTSWTWNNMLSYDKSFGLHNVELMASYESYKYFYETLSGTKTGFAIAGQQQPANAATIEDFSGYTETSTLLSYLGRVKYNYAGKYFAEFTARRDVSSIFAPGYRVGWFPAAGVSWLISEEGFLKSSENIDMLKLRLSYGSLGNNGLSNLFPYLSTYSTGYNELTNPGVYLTNLANSRIQWEKQITSNIGIDFSLFSSRLSGSLDLFDKSSENLLYNRPLAPSVGFASLQTNIGKLQNRGVELNLTYNIIRNERFNWDVSFNATYLQNKIVSLLPGQDTVASSGAFRNVVGKSIYEFYMPLWAGVDSETGAPMWYIDEEDGNGNPTGKKITTTDLTEALNYQEWVGSGLPKYTGGFATRLNYLGFDLSILFNYAFGGKYYDNNYADLMHGTYYGPGYQMHIDQLKRWNEPGDITEVPILNMSNGDGNNRSTRFLYSGDYLRLRNLTIGYSFNPDKNRKVFKNIRFYVQADNLATWDKLKDGSDPEAALNGNADNFAVPFKTLSAGLDFTF